MILSWLTVVGNMYVDYVLLLREFRLWDTFKQRRLYVCFPFGCSFVFFFFFVFAKIVFLPNNFFKIITNPPDASKYFSRLLNILRLTSLFSKQEFNKWSFRDQSPCSGVWLEKIAGLREREKVDAFRRRNSSIFPTIKRCLDNRFAYVRPR